MLKVKVKKLHINATIPKYALPGDCGLDLTCTSIEIDPDSKQVTYGTGLAFEIPDGHVGLLFPRSSICKTNLSLNNSVGILDSKFRGEVKAKFNVIRNNTNHYDLGDRIAQLVILPYPEVSLQEVDELDDTERGDGAYGSSGK